MVPTEYERDNKKIADILGIGIRIPNHRNRCNEMKRDVVKSRVGSSKQREKEEDFQDLIVISTFSDFII